MAKARPFQMTPPRVGFISCLQLLCQKHRPSSHCCEVQITPQPDEFVGPTSWRAPVGLGNSNGLETHPVASEGSGERPGVAFLMPSGLYFFLIYFIEV